jgi:crotonobetainyl-CoA:carnitine CoA-transferase CaiB-like acyl-CoA transferase
MDEWNAAVRAWTTRTPPPRSSSARRCCASRWPPVNDGRSVKEHEHFAARGVFVKNPVGRIRAAAPARTGSIRPEPAAAADEPAAGGARRPDQSPGTSGTLGRAARTGDALPLAGVRVLDATAWWAGPSATWMLAVLGAEVIHLEAIQRPDGMRMAGGALIGHMPSWWEYSHIFCPRTRTSAASRSTSPTRAASRLAKRVIAQSDVFVENFSPRVIEQFGLDLALDPELNPRTILVRMPAFGLSGPWRDHVGFAQTMEQITGLAWLTGHPHDQPRIQRGRAIRSRARTPAFATLVALAERERTGTGHLVECAMVEGALNAAAEQIVEHGATTSCSSARATARRTPRRRISTRAAGASSGSRSRSRATRSGRRWSSASAAGWALSADFATHAGPPRASRPARCRARALGRRPRSRADRGGAVAAGVPAAPVVDPRTTYRHPQLVARGFYETIRTPVVGTHPCARRRSGSRASRAGCAAPRPTLGEHNHEVLGGLLGLGAAELSELESRAGDRNPPDRLVGSAARGQGETGRLAFPL